MVTASGSASDEIRGVERTGTEAGRTSFANYLFMPPGASTLTYLWTVPEAAVQADEGWVYELVIQKQPSARSHPRSVRLDLPPTATVTELSEGASVDGSRVTYQADLDQDRLLRVVYELETADLTQAALNASDSASISMRDRPAVYALDGDDRRADRARRTRPVRPSATRAGEAGERTARSAASPSTSWA